MMIFFSNWLNCIFVITATYNAEPIPNLFVKLLARDKTHEMQMAAAQCLTYLCRGGAISPDNPIIVLKVRTFWFKTAPSIGPLLCIDFIGF